MPNVNTIVGNDGSNSLQGTAGADLIYGFDPNGPQSQASSITAERVATNLPQALFAVAPPGRSQSPLRRLENRPDQNHRSFHRPGSGYAVSRRVQPDPDGRRAWPARTCVRSEFRQQRLLLRRSDQHQRQHRDPPLSRVVEPEHRRPGKRHADHHDQSSHSSAITKAVGSVSDPTAISMPRWAMAAAAAIRWAAGKTSILLLGKILRIDVHSDGFPGDPTRNYTVPADNPFVGLPGADEIFALGLRNPWRLSFDRALGDFYIADVGQNQFEEIDLGQIGANYGWNAIRGSGAFSRRRPAHQPGRRADLLL